MAVNDILTDGRTGKKWRQVRKDTALKAFKTGKAVLFCPAKLHPFGAWKPGVVRVHGPEHDESPVARFERITREMLHSYHEPECGDYLHYYLKFDPAEFGLKTRPEEAANL